MATQARSIASLTISFGLVAIPVKLYSATVSSERISFNLLRQKDGSRVKQQYVAVKDGTPVERSEMVKGYEFAKDQYVMFSAEELKALEDTTTPCHRHRPVRAARIGRSGVLRRHLLSGARQGRRQALHAARDRAAQEPGNARVGRWVSRGKEHIVVIRPIEDGLAMHQLHFKAEVRDAQGSRHRARPGVRARAQARAAAHRAPGRRSASIPTNITTSSRAASKRRSRRRSRARKISLAEAPVPARAATSSI